MTVSRTGPGASRRGVLTAALAIASAALFGVAPVAADDTYPNRPIRIVVPFPPGGSGDTMTRIAAEALSSQFKQQVLVINMPGAASAAAAAEVLNAPRDGYTLIQASSAFVLNPFFAKDLTFDVVKDFTPISSIVAGAQILTVNNDVPTGSWEEFATYWKTHEKDFNVATYGYGSAAHLLAFQVSDLMGIEPFYIHYPGGGPAYAAIVRGDAHAIFSTLAPALPQINGGKVKAVAVTSANRSKFVPDVPTLKELGVDFVEDIVLGLAVASGTPDAIVQRIADALAKGMNTDDIRKRVEASGLEVSTNTPAEYAALLEGQREALGSLLAKKPLSTGQ